MSISLLYCGTINEPSRLRFKQYRAPKKDEERRAVVKTPEPPAWMVKPLKPPRAAGKK